MKDFRGTLRQVYDGDSNHLNRKAARKSVRKKVRCLLVDEKENWLWDTLTLELLDPEEVSKEIQRAIGSSERASLTNLRNQFPGGGRIQHLSSVNSVSRNTKSKGSELLDLKNLYRLFQQFCDVSPTPEGNPDIEIPLEKVDEISRRTGLTRQYLLDWLKFPKNANGVIQKGKI